MWISLASRCNIFVTLGLDFNRVGRSQNGTCNAELSTIKPESSESIQSKITEPECAEFSVTQVGNSGGLSNTPKLSPMCSARLFRLMAERYFLFLSRTDPRRVRSTLAGTNCLHRFQSSLFAKIFDPVCSC